MFLQLASGNATCNESTRQIALKNNVMVKGKKKNKKTSTEYLMGTTTSSQTNQYGYSKHRQAHSVARREAGKGR